MKVLVVMIVICLNPNPLDSSRMMRDYMPTKYENCNGNSSMQLDLTMAKHNFNHQMTFSAAIFVSHEIVGNLALSLETHQCDLSMTKCNRYKTLNFPEMCKKFKEKNAFYSTNFEQIKPPFECPIKPGNYSIERTTMDLTLASLMPIDDYIFISYIKLVSSVKGSKEKKIEMCLNSETKIVKIRLRSKSSGDQ